MPLKSPNLDNRKYDDIVQEIKRLIPTYAPEWTDWNEHDPGISLIQLFSHLAEMIIYRLNQVPDKNYIEFLKLIGIELKPAVPSKAHLTFTLTDPLSEPELDMVIIPKGTAISAEASDGKEPIIFETDDVLKASTVSLKGIQSFYKNSFHKYKLADEKSSEPVYPFGPEAEKDSALYLGFDRPFPQDEVSLRIQLYTKDQPVANCRCEFKESQVYPPADLVWEFKKGEKWEALTVTRDDDTLGFLRSGYIYFRGPANPTPSQEGTLITEELYWIRCRVKTPGFEIAPMIERILLNTIPATNAVTVKEEILGESDGSPNQRFVLKTVPVISGTVVLEVAVDEDWKKWQEVENFSGSLRDSQHYTLNSLTGEMSFGDMVHGQIPFAGNRNIKAGYRYGGGKRGNVAPGTIETVETSLPDVEKVTNYLAAAGGEDEETLEAAKKRGPQKLKTKHRAVTSDDFEYLAKETPGMRVSRAKALPLYHPDFSPDQKIPGVVTVIIVPESEANKPLPSEGMIRTVCEYLNKYRLATTELYVIPPSYKKVRVEAKIIAQNWADLRNLQETVLKKLNEYYHPLKGGPNQSGWPFGGDIHFSEAYRVILSVPEVRRITELVIYVDDTAGNKCEDVIIPDNFLVYSDKHKIEVDYDREGQ